MDTEKIIVKCEIPYLIRTDNPGTEEFEMFSIPRKEYTAQIGFRMAPGGGGGNITTAGASDEDRLGHMSTTHVKAVLNTDFIDNIPDDVHRMPESLEFRMGSGGNDEASYIVEEVTQSINQFLDIYKSKTGSYWMRRLLPHDIFDFAIVKVDSEGGETQQHHKHTASPMTGMGSTLSGEEKSEIEDMLAEQEIPSIYSRLQLQIRDQVSLKEFGVAVVGSQRLMESWLKESFEHLLKTSEGYSQSNAESTARHQDGSFKDFHDIRKMYNSKLGFALEDTTEFEDWEDTAREVRNNIIHEGYEPTENEAITAIQINNRLMIRVKSEFKSDLRSGLLAVEEIPEDGVGRTTFRDA